MGSSRTSSLRPLLLEEATRKACRGGIKSQGRASSEEADVLFVLEDLYEQRDLSRYMLMGGYTGWSFLRSSLKEEDLPRGTSSWDGPVVEMIALLLLEEDLKDKPEILSSSSRDSGLLGRWMIWFPINMLFSVSRMRSNSKSEDDDEDKRLWWFGACCCIIVAMSFSFGISMCYERKLWA